MIKTLSGRQFPQFVIPIIEKAKNSIDIVVFDWRWYPNEIGASIQLFNQAIVRASRRCVKIRAISTSIEMLNILAENGIQTKKLLTQKLVHPKLMIIDEKTVVTGSHNYTLKAFTTNFELSVILDEIENIKDFTSYFLNLWKF